MVSLVAALLGSSSAAAATANEHDDHDALDETVREFLLEAVRNAFANGAEPDDAALSDVAEACDGFVPGAVASFQRDSGGFRRRLRALVCEMDEGGVVGGGANGTNANEDEEPLSVFRELEALTADDDGEHDAASVAKPASVVRTDTKRSYSSSSKPPSCTTARKEPEPAKPRATDPRVRTLMELAGVEPTNNNGNDEDDAMASRAALALQHVLHVVCMDDVDAAAQWILENGLTRAQELWDARCRERERRAKEEAERDARERERVLARFGEVVVPSGGGGGGGGGASSSSSKSAAPKHDPYYQEQSKLRFRDGKVVATNGAKFIIESLQEEWDGGSRGRVKTKGKRGTGWKEG